MFYFSIPSSVCHLATRLYVHLSMLSVAKPLPACPLCPSHACPLTPVSPFSQASHTGHFPHSLICLSSSTPLSFRQDRLPHLPIHPSFRLPTHRPSVNAPYVFIYLEVHSPSPDSHASRHSSIYPPTLLPTRSPTPPPTHP